MIYHTYKSYYVICVVRVIDNGTKLCVGRPVVRNRLFCAAEDTIDLLIYFNRNLVFRYRTNDVTG